MKWELSGSHCDIFLQTVHAGEADFLKPKRNRDLLNISRVSMLQIGGFVQQHQGRRLIAWSGQ